MIAIICCGNPNRSDDGVGPEVFRLLRNRFKDASGMRLLDAGTDGMAVMFAARGCKTLIVVDASSSGSEPGAIFDVPGDQSWSRPEPALSSHEFRWEHALFVGRKIFGDDFPPDVRVFLIEAANLALGLALSPPVRRAAVKLADRIEALVQAQTAMPAP